MKEYSIIATPCQNERCIRFVKTKVYATGLIRPDTNPVCLLCVHHAPGADLCDGQGSLG